MIADVSGREQHNGAAAGLVERARALELGKFGSKSLLFLILTVHFEHVTEPLWASNPSSVNLGPKYLRESGGGGLGNYVEGGGWCVH